MSKIRFKELATAPIGEKRNIVISEAFDKDGNSMGYSIATQYVIESDGKEVKLFQKRGIGIVDDVALINITRALEKACSDFDKCEM